MKKIFITISLLILFWTMAFSMSIVQINPFETNSVTVNVLDDNSSYTVIEILLNHYGIGSLEIEGNEYNYIHLPSHAVRLEKGNPELPIVARSIAIPPQALMHSEILESTFNNE